MMAVTECSELAYAAGYERVARRNNSLSSAGRILVFAFLFIVSIGIACAFAALGAWMILPFAGLEMLGLLLAFYWVDRHAEDYERIAIAGDCLKVEHVEAGRTRSHEFNCCWAQLVASSSGARLALRSHGRDVEIGRHMSDEQRLSLARELKRQLRAAAAR